MKKYLSIPMCLMASAIASADINLPNPVSSDLTEAQITENLEYLSGIASQALDDIETLQQVTVTPVLERMDAGDEVTLLQQNDVTVKAACSYVNESEASQGRKLMLWSEVTEAGSLIYTDNDSSGYIGDEDNQTSLWFDGSTSDADQFAWNNYIDQGVIVTRTGDVIMMDGETFGYGINVQGADCLVSGQIHSFNGGAAPESFDPALIEVNNDF